jgi:hypothetical protein
MARSAAGESGSGASASSSERSNRYKSNMPSAATASNPAVRAAALLIPEASPAWRGSTAPMTAVVSGATVSPIPTPRVRSPGKKARQ